MKLYYAPGTCAVACWITMEWAKADYEVERVKTGSDEYKKINPLGAVPALDIGDGKTPYTQAHAILEYIINTHKEADLGPDEGAEESLLFDGLASFLSADVHPSFWPMFFPTRYTASENEEEQKKVTEASYKLIDKTMTHLDKLLDGRVHVYKNKRTYLDAYAYVMVMWTKKTPKPYTEYKNIKKFVEDMESDPVVKKVVEESTK